MILNEQQTGYRYKGVRAITRICIDTAIPYNNFLNQFITPYKNILIQGHPEYENEVSQLFYHTVVTALTVMHTGLKTFTDKFTQDLDLSVTVFSSVLFSHPMIRDAFYNIALNIAIDLYFKLRSYNFLSDENIYVLENVHPEFITMTIYPLE